MLILHIKSMFVTVVPVVLYFWMGPGILVLGHYYFGHTAVLVIDKFLSYDHKIVGEILHIFLVVGNALGQLPLVNNVHDLVLNNHLFEHRVVGMEPVVEMHTALVDVDTIVVLFVDIVDTVDDVLLWVSVGS